MIKYNNIKYTFQEVKEYIEKLGYELISQDYKNNITKLLLKDKYSYYYFISFISLKSGNIPYKFDKSNPYTIQNIKLWCKLNNKPFELVSEVYKNNSTKLKWKCLKLECGEMFEATWSNIYKNKGCPYCVGQKVGLSNCLATKNPELAKEWHPTKNRNLTPYDVTCGNGKKVWWLCKKGHEWQAIILGRNRGNGCPYCAHQLPSKNYNLLVINPELCKEWDYNKNNKNPEDYCPNANKKVWWKCSNLECGYEWQTTIGHRNTGGRGCPQCNESKGEQKISNYLKINNINNKPQYIFDNLLGIGGCNLRFDFGILNENNILKYLIEYDGIFHYKKLYDEDGFETLKYHDQLKNNYCKQNNIPLLRIPYWEFNNVENILNNWLKKEMIK